MAIDKEALKQQTLFSVKRRGLYVVAGAGFEPATFGL
jgi:hypothetical protein